MSKLSLASPPVSIGKQKEEDRKPRRKLVAIQNCDNFYFIPIITLNSGTMSASKRLSTIVDDSIAIRQTTPYT